MKKSELMAEYREKWPKVWKRHAIIGGAIGEVVNLLFFRFWLLPAMQDWGLRDRRLGFFAGLVVLPLTVVVLTLIFYRGALQWGVDYYTILELRFRSQGE